MENKKETAAYVTDEVEIDLWELLLAWKKKIWLILAVTLLGGLLSGSFSFFVLTPQFSSTAMMYILSKETTLTSLADLQIGSQLTADYKVIVTSRPVLQEVVEKLDLDVTYKELGKKVSIGNPADTRILSITATDPDPQMAKRIADQVANTASEYIGDIMEMVPPKMIESGEVATQKTSPSNAKNALIGALLGMMLSCGVIAAGVILNDTIRTEEDVTKYLGLSLLAAVPQRENETAEDKKAMATSAPSGESRSRRRKKVR